ncbi:peptidoglycan-binding protein [Streptomyces sp. NPDC048018]|uniref:peptidoglycan-binding protein n=1 Tax=Streptomyces sp. NPDC048018 TaxID=3365499 RepID=UPI0037174ADE
MATPMTPDQWLKALREEGVTDIVEMPGWRTHNRGQRGDGWGDVHATMVHHTAGEGSGLPAWCYNGNSDLPGPLCHDYLARSGRLYLVGSGRANHAGMVAANAYDAVLHERAEHPEPGPDALDGNARSYGMEVENSGAAGRPWPKVQYDVAVRVQAARCRFHGWTANSIWAHKEATRRKPMDPRIDMDVFRRDVAERLRHPASWNPGAPDTPPTTKPQPKPPAQPAPKPKPPAFEPFPGAAFFLQGGKPALGKSSPIFTAMGRRLVALGFGRFYRVGPGPTLGQADVDAYQAYQRSLGFTGDDAKWPPGPTSWARLRVPNV